MQFRQPGVDAKLERSHLRNRLWPGTRDNCSIEAERISLACYSGQAMQELLHKKTAQPADHDVLSGDPWTPLLREGWRMPVVLLACCAFLYLQVFILSDIPHVAAGDQAIYLHHAARMFEGQLTYRDYDHFTTPGTDVLYAALFKLFGVRAWVPQ